ncbi:DEIH-box ATPase [Ceratobasidium sp. 392]|nr:DEIH-box ATPase [Ceratobasidium sp. 392]
MVFAAIEDCGYLNSNNKVKLLDGSLERTKKGYEEIHIPKPKPRPAIPGDLVEISRLPTWAHDAFSGMPTPNRIQSRLYPVAFGQDDIILLCAPTGAGKTNVAMLTIHNESLKVRDEETGAFDLDSFKIIYIAPMKALVQDMVGSFSKRLQPYGVKIGELTGDSQLTKQQIPETQIVVTTSDKRDVITRKSIDTSFTNLIHLVVIITDKQHVHRVYDGTAKYIKGEWAIKGILPKDTNIEELRITALDIERAHKIRKSIEQNDDHRRKRDRSKSPDHCYDNRRNRKFGDRFERKDNKRNDKPDNHQGNKSTHGKEQSENWKKKNAPSNPKAAKTPKQRNEYWAANKCFECGEVSYFVKDCPSRNKARPSRLSTNAASLKPEEKVRASALLLKEFDKLTEVKESIKVSSIGLSAAKLNGKKAKEENNQRFIERNATRVKDLSWKVPATLVAQAEIKDSGSQADILSSTIVDQLKLEKYVLTKPLQLQMAMAGSRGMLTISTNAQITYQSINEKRDFDVGNLESYNAILGMPFLYQHSMQLSFNPNSVFIGSDKSLPLDGLTFLTQE